MEYLFLCAMGMERAPTARDVARKIAKERGLEIEMSSSGFDVLERLLLDNAREYLRKFDRIFVMEEYMEKYIVNKLGIDRRKVLCLYIPEEYERDDTDLIDILENSLRVEIKNR